MQLPFLFKILGIPFFSYTTLIITGTGLALLAATWRVRQAGGQARWVAEAFVWMAMLGLMFGRIFHLFYNADYYLERPTQLVRFADGGMSFVGVFCGVVGGLWLWARRHRLRFWQAADWAALPVALLATFGWLGAFMTGSQYGAPTEHWMALELRDTFGIILARWPTQLLAALWSALIGLVLIVRDHKQDRQMPRLAGTSSLFFLITYSIGLFIIDLTRGDNSIYILGFRLTQCLYLVLFVVSIFNIGRK